MCCFSMCGQIVYGILMLACTVLTAIALFTDGWSEDPFTHKSQGIMPWTCIQKGLDNSCKDWWSNIKDWQRAVAVLMCIALALECIALIWNLITFFACCCKKYIIHPLSILAFLITIFLATSVIVYGASNKDVFKGSIHDSMDSSLGWSFWMAVAAVAVAAADCVVGVLTVCLGRSGL